MIISHLIAPLLPTYVIWLQYLSANNCNKGVHCCVYNLVSNIHSVIIVTYIVAETRYHFYRKLLSISLCAIYIIIRSLSEGSILVINICINNTVKRQSLGSVYGFALILTSLGRLVYVLYKLFQKYFLVTLPMTLFLIMLLKLHFIEARLLFK